MTSADGVRYGSRMFFLWGGLCGCAYVYTYLLVPETKALTLEQIDMMLEDTIPRLSTGWTPTTTFVEQRGLDNRGRLREAQAGEEGHKLGDLPRDTPSA